MVPVRVFQTKMLPLVAAVLEANEGVQGKLSGARGKYLPWNLIGRNVVDEVGASLSPPIFASVVELLARWGTTKKW